MNALRRRDAGAGFNEGTSCEASFHPSVILEARLSPTEGMSPPELRGEVRLFTLDDLIFIQSGVLTLPERLMSMHESTAELAYRLWVARGRPDGSAEDDWREAERQLQRTGHSGTSAPPPDEIDTSLEDSFPASDAPASHHSDVPPANAPDKWLAAGKSPKMSPAPQSTKKSS